MRNSYSLMDTASMRPPPGKGERLDPNMAGARKLGSDINIKQLDDTVQGPFEDLRPQLRVWTMSSESSPAPELLRPPTSGDGISITGLSLRLFVRSLTALSRSSRISWRATVPSAANKR